MLVLKNYRYKYDRLFTTLSCHQPPPICWILFRQLFSFSVLLSFSISFGIGMQKRFVIITNYSTLSPPTTVPTIRGF